MVVNRLNAAFCRNVKAPRRYGDGNGLMLLVRENGSKSWVQRVTVNGKRRDLGLGSYQFVSLKEARESAYLNRKIARTGGDPLAERQAKAAMPTFEEAMERVIEIRRKGWTATHERNWRNQMAKYALPRLGRMKVNAVTADDVLRVVAPHWHDMPKVARDVRARIAAVLDWAVALSYLSHNPAEAALKGALPKQTKPTRHHAALPYADVPAAVATIRESNAYIGTRLTLRFLILTAARSGEARGARWEEIDLEARTWTVPAERMKSRREHVVPLSDAALDALREAAAIRDRTGLVFPSAHGKVATDMVPANLLRKLEIGGSVHGMRTAFRVWAAERSPAPREVAEMALAHTVGDMVERAYQRSDLFEKRRDLMERWAQFVERVPGKVVALA